MECYLVELKKKEKVRFPSGISTFWTGNDTSTPNLYLQCPQSSWGQGVKPYSESGVGRGRGQKIFDKQPWYTMVCSLGCQIFPAFISQVKFLNLPIWEKIWRFYPDIVVVVQLLSCVWLLVIPWTAACQTSLPVCPSLSPRVCSNSCPLSRWWHPTISSSVTHFSYSQYFPASRFFPVRQIFLSGSQSIGASASASIGPSTEYEGLISFRIDWFDLLAVQGTLKRIFQDYNLKASILWCSTFFMVHLSHLCMTTGKTIVLTIWTFVGKVISLLFNMLSRVVITFLLRINHLLISWLQSPSALILEPKKIKFVTVSLNFSSVCHEVMGPDAMIFVFWMVSFKPAFPLSSFTFIKRLFSFSWLSAIKVVSSTYLRSLIFLPAIFIPTCASSSSAFSMMYSTYKLNKQGDSIQTWCCPFPILNPCVVPCAVLTVAAWPAYMFLRRWVRWSDISISLRIFQFVVIHTVKDFSQWSRSRCFSRIPLLFLWSNRCWQFNFWFFCLF